MGKADITVKYADDRPSDCNICSWWDSKENKCKLGEENCYYLIPDARPKRIQNPCLGCPYGKSNPCVGFCMRKILRK